MFAVSINHPEAFSISPHGNRINWLITKEKCPCNFELRYIQIPAGSRTGNGHHPYEHEVFVVFGKGLLLGVDLWGQKYEEELFFGKSIFVQSDEIHQWVNTGAEELCLVCVIPSGAEDEFKTNYIVEGTT